MIDEQTAVGSRFRLSERSQTIVLLGGVLALDGADKSAVGAIARPLKDALDIGNFQIGLLVAASTAIGAITTLPIGALVDRVHRVRLLVAMITVWSLAMIVSGFTNSFVWLLISRLALGGVAAVAAPAVASLTGDFFASVERGRIWSYLLGGELLGSAVGLALCGTIAGMASWRAAFWLLGAIGLGFAVLIAWGLREPARGGAARLTQADTQAVQNDENEVPSVAEQAEAREDVTASHTAPRRVDPGRMAFIDVLRYILSIRTNVILIVASALGYFYFTGLRSFGVTLIAERFGLSQSVASLTTVALGTGSIIGVLIAGRVTDRLIAGGWLNARILVPAAALFGCGVLMAPGVLATTLWITGPLLFLSAACFGASNPPLDAARLDVMHSHVWGRAEGVRTVIRNAFEAVAPLAFGGLAALLGGGGGVFAARGQASSDGVALAWTFLAMGITLVAGGLILLLARHSYARDVADAAASERATGP